MSDETDREFRKPAPTVDVDAVLKVAEEVYEIGALLKTPPPRDFYRLAAALRKACGK